MESIKLLWFILCLINFITLSEGRWSAEGRIGLRFYRDVATSFLDEPMETGLRIFNHPHYNRSLPLLILIHGMGASVECEFVEGSVKAMYFRGLNRQFNIIALNLPELIAKQNVYDKYLYTTAKNSKLAGEAIGEFLNDVIQLQYTTLDKIHVVGYSMGAQVAGYLGRKVKDVHGLIHFIMGLDPAGIGFTKSTIAAWFTRLIHVSSSDAVYTHFVHCNSLGWGTLMRNATANFIFNGGNIQPGCMGNANVACSHNRVPFYFIESILYPKGFLAERCESWKSFCDCECLSEDLRHVTFPPDLRASGIYHLRTEGYSKFGLGKGGVACLRTENEAGTEEESKINLKEKILEELKETAEHRKIRHESMTGHELHSKYIKPGQNAHIKYHKRIHKVHKKFGLCNNNNCT